MMAISLYGFSIEMLYVEICISETRRKSCHLRNGELWCVLEIIRIGELSYLLFGKEERRSDISFHINLKTRKPNIICLGHHLFKISCHSIPKESRQFLE